MKHHTGLQCGLEALEYSYTTHRLVLRLPLGECCDMPGAIRFATRLFPDVATIETYSGSEPDTIYRQVNGEWTAGLRKRRGTQ